MKPRGLKIFINTLSVTPDKSGIKTFLLNLIEGAVRVDPRNEYRLICGQHNRPMFDPLTRDVENLRIETLNLRHGGTYARILYDQFVIPRYLRDQKPDVLLTPSNICSLRAKVPQVVVIQSPLSVRSVREDAGDFAKMLSTSQRVYFDRAMPRSLRTATRVVCVSEYLHRKLIESHPEAENKSVVIHEGVNVERFLPDNDHPEPPAPGSQTPRPPKTAYVLFVSTLFPYKNPDKLLRAFGTLHHRAAVPGELRLKIAGRDADGKQFEILRALAHELGVHGSVDLLGHQSLDQLKILYRDAAAFVYPSSVETFGLPILEAMASGTPVVASDRMSIPEIVGDAGLTVNPDDVNALADAIERVLHDKDLRASLILAGRERVRQFTWDHTAKKMITVLEDAVKNGSNR